MPEDFQPITPGEFLESRMTEQMFRRFEPLLTKAVDAFPNETSFTVPPDMAPTTFLARFRDARLSLLKYNWQPTTVNRDKLIQIARSHTISRDEITGLVWFRAKHARGRPKELVTEAMTQMATASSPIDRVWSNWSVEELRAACLLLSSKRLTGPIILRGAEIPDSIINDLLADFDISIVRQDGTTEIEYVLM